MVLLVVIAYGLMLIASATSFKELRIDTKVLIMRDQLKLSIYSGWNIISPMITLTISVLIRAHRGVLLVPTYACIAACLRDPELIPKNDFCTPASRSQ